MSSKGKRYLINSMIVIPIMLFVIGYMVGEKIEKKEEKEKLKEEQVSLGESFSHSEVDRYHTEEDDNHQSNADQEHYHGEYEYENPEVDKNEEPLEKSTTLSDLFDEKELEESKEVARKFVAAYYPLDGENPAGNIDKSKEYMTSALYRDLKGEIVRPTNTVFKKKLTSIEVYEPYNPTDEHITWNVRVKGEVFDIKGNLTKDEIYDYSLKLIKENQEFKVDKLLLNTPY